MAKVIVTGGAGFIGSHLVDALVERGDEVIVVDNLVGGRREQINSRATFLEFDVTDRIALTDVFSGVETVFHLAALPSVPLSIEQPLLTHDVNLTGTLNVFWAACEAGVKRAVFSSSSAVYGDQSGGALVETLPARPKSPYGLQKYLGELYAQTFVEIYRLPVVCLRYFNVYGPRQSDTGAYASVISRFLAQAKSGQAFTVTGDGLQTRDFIHVRDVVTANLVAAEMPLGEERVFNIGSGRSVSIKQLAELFGGPIEYQPARLEPRNSLADINLAQTILGWTPTVELSAGITELKTLTSLD